MEAYSSSIPVGDEETKDLKQLLDAFGSVVSLNEIASAYCQAGRNIHTAGEILCNLRGGTSGVSTLSSKDESKDELEGLSGSSDLSNDYLLDKANFVESNFVSTKQKKSSASMGTVSGVIGRDYARSTPSRNESCVGTRPMKVNSEELPISETSIVESMHKDREEFLFRMLGDGFQLDKETIQEVLGLCGYDVEMSMDKLLDLSASTMKKNGDALNITAGKSAEICSDTCTESARRSGHVSSKSNKGRYDLQKELLEALFTVPGKIEEAPKRTRSAKPYKKARGFGRIVTEPYSDNPMEVKSTVATLLVTEEKNEDDEDSYQALRKAVKEYWITMKEYYKAAVDAFTKGNRQLENKLLEEGHFFKRKAREADEQSAQKFLEPREEGMSLDLHDYEPKEVIRLLRRHLTFLSGIQDFPYLKVVVGGDTEDTKDGARKRLVVKFLEKESINWSEERNGRTIVIRLGEIDRKCLTFGQK